MNSKELQIFKFSGGEKWVDKEIPALYAIEYPPFTGFALTAFPVFFCRNSDKEPQQK